jgi:hypothetical protein
MPEQQQPAASTVPTVFPHELTLSLTLKLSVVDADDLKYYTSIGFKADLFDILCEATNMDLISINDKTLEQIRLELSKAEGIS